MALTSTLVSLLILTWCLIIHNPTASGGDKKDSDPNTFVDPSSEGNEYWAVSGIAKLYTFAADQGQARVISGDLNTFISEPTRSQSAGAGLYQHQAFWIGRTMVAIPAAGEV